MRQTNRECSAGREPNRDIPQPVYLGSLSLCEAGRAAVCDVTAHVNCHVGNNVTFNNVSTSNLHNVPQRSNSSLLECSVNNFTAHNVHYLKKIHKEDFQYFTYM